MDVEKVKWRGTHGVGDFMQALNVCHRYSFDHNDTPVNLEMHWEHDEDYLYHPNDPETIIERMRKIHKLYHESERVEVTHVYNSKEFYYEDSEEKDKRRYEFASGRYDPTGAPPNDWIFRESEYVEPERRIVIWTPHYNREQPRRWKRWLTSDDWYDIIQLLRWEGWILQEINYRTPILEAYNAIKKSRFVVSYDGMWHYISRNFAKPHLIPSKEGITSYNTPNAVKLKTREEMLDFFKPENVGTSLGRLNEQALSLKDTYRKHITTRI